MHLSVRIAEALLGSDRLMLRRLGGLYVGAYAMAVRLSPLAYYIPGP